MWAMPEAQPGTPVSVPDFLPLVLGPVLIAWMLFLIVAVLTFVYFRLQNRWVHYQ